VAIAALVIWLLAAAAGLTLLITGHTAKRPVVPAPASAQPTSTEPASSEAASTDPASAGPTAPGPASSGVSRAGTAPVTELGEPPPIPRVKVHATPGDHPLLEFSHPALGIVGLGCWFAFVGTRSHALAWVAFGILVVTIAAGLRWFMGNGRAGRAGNVGRLALLHGLAATSTLVLAVLTALAASHG
jgi:hypothetical protein